MRGRVSAGKSSASNAGGCDFTFLTAGERQSAADNLLGDISLAVPPSGKVLRSETD